MACPGLLQICGLMERAKEAVDGEGRQGVLDELLQLAQEHPDWKGQIAYSMSTELKDSPLFRSAAMALYKEASPTSRVACANYLDLLLQLPEQEQKDKATEIDGLLETLEGLVPKGSTRFWLLPDKVLAKLRAREASKDAKKQDPVEFNQLKRHKQDQEEEGPKAKKHKAVVEADVMECNVCFYPMSAPWMCAGDQGCGQSLCQSCVIDTKTQQPKLDKCPLCQLSPGQFKPNRALADLLGKTSPQPDFLLSPKKTIKDQILELWQPLKEADPRSNLKATKDQFPFWLPFMEKVVKGRDILGRLDNSAGDFLQNCVNNCPGGDEFDAFMVINGAICFNSAHYANVFVCKFKNNHVFVFKSNQ